MQNSQESKKGSLNLPILFIAQFKDPIDGTLLAIHEERQNLEETHEERQQKEESLTRIAKSLEDNKQDLTGPIIPSSQKSLYNVGTLFVAQMLRHTNQVEKCNEVIQRSKESKNPGRSL